MGKQYVVSKWRYWCPIRNRYLITRYKTTADQIQTEYPDATPVAGTEEVREEPDNLYDFCTSMFMSEK